MTHCIYPIQRPSDRVRWAMTRVTRNKWIPGSEVRRIGFVFSKIASRTPSQTFDVAIRRECEFIGMINGNPPCYDFEDNYGRIFDAVKHAEKKGEIDVLFAILKYSKQLGAKDEYNRRFTPRTRCVF